MTTTTREQTEQRINEALERANGKRRERTLGRQTIDWLIEDVVTESKWSTANGGTVANAYDYPATTTIAVVARINGRIYLGITTCQAHAASPGRAWASISPWRPNQWTEKTARAKWLAWSQSADVFPID